MKLIPIANFRRYLFFRLKVYFGVAVFLTWGFFLVAAIAAERVIPTVITGVVGLLMAFVGYRLLKPSRPN